MTNMVPKAAGKFDAWCRRFLDAASAADDRLGLNEDYIGRMKRTLEEWRVSHEQHRRMRAQMLELSKVRTRTRAACEKAFRACARMVQARSETTDELRDALGLTVRGRRPGKVALEDLKPPLVNIDHSERGRATIRIRQHDGRRGKPRGAYGTHLFCRFEGGGPGRRLYVDTGWLAPTLRRGTMRRTILALALLASWAGASSVPRINSVCNSAAEPDSSVKEVAQWSSGRVDQREGSPDPLAQLDTDYGAASSRPSV